MTLAVIMPLMIDFIAYFRVSTDRQGKSGLGLDAQREAVTRYVEGRGIIVEEFTEIESGKKNSRQQLPLLWQLVVNVVLF